MIIRTFPSGPFATNAYAVACPVTKRVAIVDPAPGCQGPIEAFIQDHHLIPDKILITHSHWDHIADAAALKEKYNIPLYVHPEDAQNLERPGSDGLPFRMNIPSTHPDHLLTEGEVIHVGDISFEVIETPGHSPGGVCFYCKEEGILFSGDTLFKGTFGNTSFPTARPRQMWESLKKLSKLPAETTVYPGHGLRTTIGAEPWLANAEETFG